MKTGILRILLIFVLVLITATLPTLISLGRPSIQQYYSDVDDPDFMADRLYKLHIHLENLWRKPFLYFRSIKGGMIFKYMDGKTSWNYLTQAPRYFLHSLFLLIPAAMISLFSGLYLSLKQADRRKNSSFYHWLSFITIIPDFILIFLLQFLFYYINQAAGTILVKTNTLHASNRALLLPLMIMCSYPTLYIVRTLGDQLKEINRQPYILFARSRGISSRKIKLFHIGPAALHYVQSDIHKMITLLFTNLFITEWMFNNQGITSFLFNNISQYAATVNSIILMLFMYFILYILLKGILVLCGWILRRDYL